MVHMLDFSERFPSLISEIPTDHPELWGISADIIDERCLDKQLVKDIFNRHLNSEAEMECPEGVVPSCQEPLLREILEELGLGDG